MCPLFCPLSSQHSYSWLRPRLTPTTSRKPSWISPALSVSRTHNTSCHSASAGKLTMCNENQTLKTLQLSLLTACGLLLPLGLESLSWDFTLYLLGTSGSPCPSFAPFLLLFSQSGLCMISSECSLTQAEWASSWFGNFNRNILWRQNSKS